MFDSTYLKEKFMQSWKSITFKGIILTSLVIVCNILIISIITVRHQISTVKTELNSRGELLSRYLTNLCYDIVIQNEFESYRLKDNVDTIAKEPDVGLVAIVNQDGIILGHNNIDLVGTKMKDFAFIDRPKFVEQKNFLLYYSPLIDGARGQIIVGVSKERLSRQVWSIITQISLISLIILIAGIVGTAFFLDRIISPIKVLIRGSQEIANKNFKYRIASTRTDEWQDLGDAFDRMAGQIEEFTENLENKVAERTEELQAAMEELEAMNDELVSTRDALWGEMMLAKKIQTILLPQKPFIDGYEICAYMNPMDEVGGDYYDVININGTNWLVIGDVSGHGVPAGLVMMMAQTAIRAVIAGNPGMPPSEILSVVNGVINGNIKKFEEKRYMTINLIALSDDGNFRFSGLHQDILIYRSETNQVERIKSRGMWIGMIDDIERMMYNDIFKLNLGDALLLYTDGVTEARKGGEGPDADLTNEGIEIFGSENLLKVFQTAGNMPTEVIKETILSSLAGYSCPDDVTLMIVKKTA